MTRPWLPEGETLVRIALTALVLWYGASAVGVEIIGVLFVLAMVWVWGR